MEYRIENRFDHELGNSLSDSVRYGGHAQLSGTTLGLGYLHLPDRRREVRPRRHPVPQLVQIPQQVLLEHGDGFIIHARSTTVSPHQLIRFPHHTLRNAI